MTFSIWKFPVVIADSFAIEMPTGSRLLSVQSQLGAPQLWALVDPTAPKVNRKLRLYGTGHTVTDGNGYVGTFQLQSGHLVFHLFDDGESPLASEAA